MAFDREKLLSMPPIVSHQDLTRRDTILYALGVASEDLDFVYEEDLKALPSMAVTLAYPGFIWRNPEIGADWTKILHGEQYLEMHAALPVEGRIRGETTIEEIYDKGKDKGAIAYLSRRIFNEADEHIATVRQANFLRGNGGCGGPSQGAPTPHTIPSNRAPDHVVQLATSTNQALVYRLSGDYNPLHIDPLTARSAGFDKPILHGLCTFGIACRAILSELAGNAPARLKRQNVRFSSPVYPGETIRVEIWREPNGQAAFRADVPERGVTVLNNGFVEMSEI